MPCISLKVKTLLETNTSSNSGVPDANDRPIWPSNAVEPAEGKEAGGEASGESAGHADPDASNPASPHMGISVALDGDARQAAAAKMAEEHGLVRKAQAGDRLAFDELVRRYDRDVLRLAMNLVHRPEDARDIYQEAFLRAYRNLHRFRFECSFYTWLYRIVTNAALDSLRRRSTHREDQAPAANDIEAGPRLFRPPAGAERGSESGKEFLGKEIGRHIEEAMERLSPRERMVFEMKHYQGFRLRAIGELLGTSEETVKNSLFRATRKLRESLTPDRVR